MACKLTKTLDNVAGYRQITVKRQEAIQRQIQEANSLSGTIIIKIILGTFNHFNQQALFGIRHHRHQS